MIDNACRGLSQTLPASPLITASYRPEVKPTPAVRRKKRRSISQRIGQSQSAAERGQT
ncbi:MAG: hypothetical protein ACK6DN_09985 [Planctomycetota bacterium]